MEEFFLNSNSPQDSPIKRGKEENFQLFNVKKIFLPYILWHKMCINEEVLFDLNFIFMNFAFSDYD